MTSDEIRQMMTGFGFSSSPTKSTVPTPKIIETETSQKYDELKENYEKLKKTHEELKERYEKAITKLGKSLIKDKEEKESLNEEVKTSEASNENINK